MDKNHFRLLLFPLFLLMFPISTVLSAQEPPWILLERGRSEFEKRHITESLDYLLQAVESNPDYPEAEYWLGRIYEAQGQAVLAEEQYRRALDLSLYLRVPQDRIVYEYTLADLLLNQGPDRKAEALSLLYGIADSDGASTSAAVSREHSYMELITEEGIDELFFLYRDETGYSLKARRILGEQAWNAGQYRSSLLLSTRVILSMLTTAADRYRIFHPEWRFDIDVEKDRTNPDRDVRYPGRSDGISDFVSRIYSSDEYLAAWLEDNGFWPQLYLLSISLYAGGYSENAESIWNLMVNRDDVTGELTPLPEAGRWGLLSGSQLKEPFISIGSISP